MNHLFLYLMLYSFLGWACESIFCSIGRKKWINSGFLFGPFCPIYGFGSVFVIYLLTPFIEHPLVVFLLSILITSVLEYFTSWLLEKLFHVMWWDYSRYTFNLNGRVCLLNSFLFGCMSLFVIYILHPFVSQWVEQIPLQWIMILQILLLIYLVVDLVLSTSQLISFKQQLTQFENDLREIKNMIRNQLPEVNLELKEKVETFFEEHHELEDIKEKLHQNYATFRENKKQLRFRRVFPDLKLTNKEKLQGFSEYLKSHYTPKRGCNE